MKKILFLIIIAPLFLSGCLGELLGLGCEFSDDETHCYQSSAVQQSDSEKCAKVETSDWPSSNPPKDKCYLLIAENTGDISACDKIEGGFGSYTREQCRESVIRIHGTPAPVEEEKPEEKPTETDEPGLSNAEQEDINTIVDAAKGKYMELLEADIESETDPGRLAGLEAYKDFLDKSGETIETVQTSFETLSDLRKIFIDSYDSKNDIENMSINKELDPGLMDKISERLFGPGEPPTGLERENGDAENSLKIYEVMLKQQEENDFLKKDKLSRLSETISSKFRDEVTGKVVDGAKEIAEGVAGTAFGAVTAVGDALEAFKDEAQHQMFLGLARAYNRRREALAAANPTADPAEIHAQAVREVKEDPYRDNTQLAVLKHGNILENTDCQDDSNPLCIDNRVFWTAMDKTFRYNNKPAR